MWVWVNLTRCEAKTLAAVVTLLYKCILCLIWELWTVISCDCGKCYKWVLVQGKTGTTRGFIQGFIIFCGGGGKNYA